MYYQFSIFLFTLGIFCCSCSEVEQTEQIESLEQIEKDVSDSTYPTGAPFNISYTENRIDEEQLIVLKSKEDIKVDQTQEKTPLTKETIANLEIVSEIYPLNTPNGILSNALALQVEIHPIKTPERLQSKPFYTNKGVANGFEYLDAEEGLPISHINCIAKGKKGDYWMGTDLGLMRYDGTHFQLFNDSNGLPYLSSNELSIDSEGNVWSCHNPSSIISFFNGQNFYSYSLPNKVDKSCIEIDAADHVWVSNNGDLFKYDRETITHYTLSNKITNSSIIDLKSDQDNNLWAFTKNELIKFDGDSFTRFPFPTEFDSTYGEIHVFENEKKSCIWIRTFDHLFAFEHGNLVEYRVGKSRFSKMIVSTNGEIWLRNQDQSLCHIQEDSIEFFGPEIESRTPQLAPQIIDDYGRIWFIDYNGGIVRYDPQAVKHIFTESVLNQLGGISAIHQDKNKDVWLGSQSTGLRKTDGKHTTSYPAFNEQVQYLRAIEEDKKNNLWIGSGNSSFTLTQFDGENFIGYGKAIGLENDRIFALEADKFGNLWIGTGTNGIFRYNEGKLRHYEFEKEDKFPIRDILIAKDGNLWFATETDGLLMFNGDHFTFFTTNEGLCSNFIISLNEDDQGNIWAGSIDSGLSIYNGMDFMNYSTKNGLSSNRIWSIIEDEKGNVWLGADDCFNIFRYHPKDKKGEVEPSRIDVVTSWNGITRSELFANAVIQDDENKLWWGSRKAASIISPNSILILDDELEVQLKTMQFGKDKLDFHLLNEVEEQKYEGLTYHQAASFENYPENLSLPHSLNDFTFEFGPTQTPKPHNVLYSTYLKGYDQSWSSLNKNQTVSYRNVPPGKYEFLIRGKTNTSALGPVFSYAFEIRYPWWRTGWAYALWLTLALGILYLVYSFLLKRKLARQHELQLAEINTLKSKLYTNFTHEFRTPLTVILGLSDQIAGNEKEKKAIKRNGQSLLNMVNQLLDLSKMEAGHLKLDLNHGDMINCLKYLTASFQSEATKHDIELSFQTSEPELYTHFDAGKMEQIFNNLLSNAFKFTPKGGQVKVLVQQLSNHLEIVVQDNGIGIEADKIPFIFDRFYQVDNSATRAAGGTGIGLSWTKELIDLMKGEIKVESEVNKGTSIKITLPIAAKSAMDTESSQQVIVQPSHQNTSQPTVPNIQAASRNVILIVEDNYDVREYLIDLLSSSYEVLSAENGELGVQLAKETIPDVIISDVMMPKKDGYELTQILKADTMTGHIPIILLTAKSSHESLISGLESKADAYMVKPFDKSELFLRIENMLSLRDSWQFRFDQEQSKTALTAHPTHEKVEVFIQELHQHILENLDDENFGVPQLANVALLSQIQLYRKLKSTANMTPSQFIKRVRLEKAKELLQNKMYSISEVAYATGFADPNYFSKSFNKEFGHSPTQFRKNL